MLQKDEPDDYVLATGETHTVREFVEKAFKVVGTEIKWKGPTGTVDEIGVEGFLAKQCSQIKENPELLKKDFYKLIQFHAGGYDSPDSFKELDGKIKAFDGDKPGNRLFFLSIPPFIFGGVCECISDNCRSSTGGFTHLIIEKPFGNDSASYQELDKKTSGLFKESELYRIDHYLGKEVVLNLRTLRFANQLFEPIWNKNHIKSIEITFKEDLGTGGRGGYFDKFGIIRDIMQNHLLQVFMFLGMEPPSSNSAEDVVAAKVDLLKAVETLTLEKGVFLGQFGPNSWKMQGEEHIEPGYLDDQTVPEGSRCPTFAALVLRVNNERWQGVPFLMKAGKGLDERMAEVRITFKEQGYNALMGSNGGNQLVMRIQPDEALYFKTFSKEPGLDQVVKPTVMDMNYATQFRDAYVGDAYERMFLNAAKGDGSLFVSSPELVEAWRIFTPLLHQIDETKPKVVVYPFGTSPPGFPEWSLANADVEQKKNWEEFLALNAGHCDDLKALFKRLDTDNSGSLDSSEVAELAKQFYDGREPTQKKIDQIVSMLDTTGDGKVTLGELIGGSQVMHNAFGVHENAFDHA